MIHFCYVNTLKNEYNNLRGDIKNNKKLHRTRTTLHNKTFLYLFALCCSGIFYLNIYILKERNLSLTITVLVFISTKNYENINIKFPIQWKNK